VRDSLRRDVVRASNERDEARARIDEQNEFIDEAYPILTGGHLRGRTIGLVLLGGDKDAPGIVDRALEPTGADLKLVAAVSDNVDIAQLAEKAQGTRYDRLADDAGLLDDFGRRIGIQVVEGGRLLSESRGVLMPSLSGSFGDLDGIVVMRSQPGKAGDESQQSRRDALYDGIARGLVETGVPVVGIEPRDSDPSQIGWYRDRDLSSVDNIDEAAGRAAMVFVLEGSDGAFGRRDSAQALLPPVVAPQ